MPQPLAVTAEPAESRRAHCPTVLRHNGTGQSSIGFSAPPLAIISKSRFSQPPMLRSFSLSHIHHRAHEFNLSRIVRNWMRDDMEILNRAIRH